MDTAIFNIPKTPEHWGYSVDLGCCKIALTKIESKQLKCLDFQEVTLQPEELARAIATIIADKKGEDVVMMDLSEVSTLTDYFIVASADNERLLNAIAENIREEVRNQTPNRLYPWRIEGRGENGWVLIDYGDVIVHLFDPEIRRYYDLEGLWRDAKVVVRIQ